MAAIGQLAGGVAHDFNNILGAIMMAADEAAAIDGVPEAVRDLLYDVQTSAERAANLTRQLLLFSRRQVMNQRDLDVNGVVTNVVRMLRRIVGADIDVVTRLNGKPLTVLADSGMLEQVLVNLAVNARDAMPGGGDLVIETAVIDVDDEMAARSDDASPGRHVCLRVRDSGTGMPPDMLQRIFEPFFTTKDPGRGTGLGLATVFGIVKQHRGWITVHSTVGRGTTFEVYIPESHGHAASVNVPASLAAPKGGTETILLVEDDASVRKFTRLVLQRAGYTVIEAPSGLEAERIWDAHPDRIHLLVTDMVMPEGVNGRELARRLRAKDARLRAIVTSGYSEEFAGRSVGADVGDEFLAKPYKATQMLDAVRRCLDAGSAPVARLSGSWSVFAP